MRTKIVIRYIFMIVSVFLMICIFIMSSQTATVSTESSGRIIRTIAKIIVENFEKKPIEYQMNYISSLQFFVRKAAHFLLYFSLGTSVCGCALTFENKTKFFNSMVSFIVSFLYAVSDEIHQIFVSGRSGQVSDVLLDTAGIIFGMLFINLAFFVVWKLYSKFSVRRKASEQ